MKRIRGFLITLALLLGIGTAVVLWQLDGTRSPQVLELSDGSTLTFHGATYGTNHFEPGHPFLPVHWQLKPWLPGFIPRPAGTVMNTPRPSLIGWFSTHFVAGSRNRMFTLSAFDPDRVELLMENSGTSYSLGSSMGTGSRGFELKRYPRRVDTLRLGVYVRSEEYQLEKLGELAFPNPDPGQYPRWSPEALPAVKSAGENLEVIVERLVAGVVRGHPDSPARSLRETYSLLECRPRQNGQPSDDWHIEGITCSDATGNVMNSHSHVSDGEADGLIRFYFEDFPWPSESPWKIRLELSQSADALTNAADLWRLEKLPLPDSETPVAFDLTNLLHGVAWQLESISPRNEAYTPPPVKAYTIRFVTQALVVSEPVQNDLLRMSDEKGRPITPSGRSSKSHPGNQAKHIRDYWLRTPVDATQVNLTLASHRSRFVEFTIAPKLPAAPEMKKATPDESVSGQ